MNEHALRALSELLTIRDEIEDLTQRRELLIHAAAQQGAGPTHIATATGLSRSMIHRMVR